MKKEKVEKPVKITKALIASVLRSKRWMLRRSKDGVSHGGFEWSPIGCWTTAPDWKPTNECGNGLHGNGPNTSPGECYWNTNKGTRLEFCEIGYERVSINGRNGKMKVKRARVLLVNELPEGFKKIAGSLDLSGTGITSLGNLESVAGSLDLHGTGITELPKSLKVKDKIYR